MKKEFFEAQEIKQIEEALQSLERGEGKEELEWSVFLKRATTVEKKKSAMQRVYHLWLKNPHLRFGQLLFCACYGQDFFVLEDDDLIALLEAWNNS